MAIELSKIIISVPIIKDGGCMIEDNNVQFTKWSNNTVSFKIENSKDAIKFDNENLIKILEFLKSE